MTMPVGYRFHPTDHEIINHYLTLKNQGAEHHVSNIQEIDVCNWEPWELPAYLRLESDDQKWYFFSRRVSKYGKSTRSNKATKDGNPKSIRYNRATKDGYWKPTGDDRYIKTGSNIEIGRKKTLVFYRGSAQNAVRTSWVMHEYCAFADQHNSQAFLLYMLKKKIDKSVEVPNSDGAELNASSPFALMLNYVPPQSPSTPTVHQISDYFTSSNQPRLTQNWNEQDLSPHGHSYPDNSAYVEDDNIGMREFEDLFPGQQPTWKNLDIILPAIPLSNVYPNQGPIHMTARYLNVTNNEPGVTQFQNIKRRGVVNSVNSTTSHSMRTNEAVLFDSESSTETDNDAPRSLFDEDGVRGGSAYFSESESSDLKHYNDMILLAQEVSLSSYSDLIQRVALKAVSDDSSMESPYEGESSNYPEVGKNKSSGAVGKSRDNIGFIYAENPRVRNGKTPPSSYITNIAIGIFLTVVITGEVLFSLVC